MSRISNSISEFNRSQSNARVSVAIFDHIISETATILPVKALTQMARDQGLKVIIDGAHAIGQVPIDISDIQPDFYFSNLHKWLCADRVSTKEFLVFDEIQGCAFLYVSNSYRDVVRPLIISHGYNWGFQAEVFKKLYVKLMVSLRGLALVTTHHICHL